MDLNAFLRVGWRFRRLLAIGFLLATLVALMSYVRVGLADGKPTVSYREPEVWLSASALLVTQEGFPWGRAILDDMIEVGGTDAEPQMIPRFGDPERYAGLAAIYAELAKSDIVKREVMRGAGPGESYEPMVAQTAGSTASLPIIYLKGYGPSPEAAASIANRAARAFRSYLDSQQAAGGISEDERVQVVLTQRATAPEIFDARSFVRPVFLFLLIGTAVVALAFALENLLPQRRAPAEMRVAEQPPARAA